MVVSLQKNVSYELWRAWKKGLLQILFESNLKIWKNPATQTKTLSSKEGDMYTAL